MGAVDESSNGIVGDSFVAAEDGAKELFRRDGMDPGPASMGHRDLSFNLA